MQWGTDRVRLGYKPGYPEGSLDLLYDLDLLLVDALVPSDIRVHKHMNYLDACSLAQKLKQGVPVHPCKPHDLLGPSQRWQGP